MDARQFDRLVKQYEPVIKGRCMNLAGQDGDDLYAEVLIDLWRYYRPELNTQFTTFAHLVTSRTWANMLRSQSLKTDRIEVTATAGHYEDAPNLIDLRGYRLTPRERQYAEESMLGGSIREIATRMGLSNTRGEQLRHALQRKLKGILEP